MKRFLSVFLMVVCLFSAMTVACIGTCVNLDYEDKDARDEALYRIESFEKATANLDCSSVLGNMAAICAKEFFSKVHIDCNWEELRKIAPRSDDFESYEEYEAYIAELPVAPPITVEED